MATFLFNLGQSHWEDDRYEHKLQENHSVLGLVEKKAGINFL